MVLLKLLRFLEEMRQPVPHQLETFVFDAIDPLAPLLPVADQAGFFEDPEVPRGGLPGVLENGRDFAGGHGAAVEINRQQHTAPGGMRQRAEDQLISVKPRFRLALQQ